MIWIARRMLFSRGRSQQQLSSRAAEVIARVLFDVGADRFLNGSLMVDQHFRVRFVSNVAALGGALAAIPVRSLASAHALHRAAAAGAAPVRPVDGQLQPLVEEAMATLLASSPALRALPAQP